MTYFSKIFPDRKVQNALIAIHNASFFIVKEGFSPENILQLTNPSPDDGYIHVFVLKCSHVIFLLN